MCFFCNCSDELSLCLAEQADGHSLLGKKRFWRQLQAGYLYNGRAVSDTQVAWFAKTMAGRTAPWRISCRRR
jgi:hypothetical protein